MKTILSTRTIAFRLLVLALCVSLVAAMSAPAVAGTSKSRLVDEDGNGISDDGEYVTGVYNAYYYYDDSGDWYWDLGDGRTQGTVAAPSDLNQSTLTTCTYNVQYRADFGNDPYMDDGWIRQTIHCEGYEPGVVTYLIVSDEDPRYTGNEVISIWGTWEYAVYTVDGEGQLVKPHQPDLPSN